MAKKFKLLLLDTNIILELFRHGLWAHLIERCDVHLARSVLDEARFYETDDGLRHDIDLQPDVLNKKISVFDLVPSDLVQFRDRFDPIYFEKLDLGETESLAYLLTLSGECWLCSADKIVYRVLGNLHEGDRGVSLEELLQQTGLARSLPPHFSKSYREQWTAKGAEEGLRDQGFKRPGAPGKP